MNTEKIKKFKRAVINEAMSEHLTQSEMAVSLTETLGYVLAAMLNDPNKIPQACEAAKNYLMKITAECLVLSKDDHD